jgi:hypothetical protein
MGHRRALSIAIAVVASLTATAIPSPAQTGNAADVLPATTIPLAREAIVPSISLAIENPSDQAQRTAAVQRWVREYTEWQEWEDHWRGRQEPGWFGPRDRKAKPDPPAWLFDECQELTEVRGTRADACRLLIAWQDDYATAQLRTKLNTARTADETPQHTTWWNHVHVDALWMAPNTSVSYGVIGVHATLKVVGRWQMFVAPGAILLNVATPEGRREWRPATDLGVSYRLVDVRLPGSQRQGTLHLNLAKAWLLGNAESFVSSSVDLVGLSMTFK